MEKQSECIKVGIRVRPLSKKEKEEKDVDIICTDEKRKEIVLKSLESGQKSTIFTFDYVFSQDNSQLDIYKCCAKNVVDSLLKGFNCTIFAYGQTGTGKTYTMEGSDDFEGIGIIPRTFEQIFDHINSNKSHQQFLIRCSMLELYNEELKDSLAGKKEKLEIHEDAKNGFYVKGLSQVTVTSSQELREKLDEGKKTRRVRATQMNDFSSRSHSIFSIIIESSEVASDGKPHFKVGKLNLVDLAGSEKQKQTKTTNEALKEGININLSLTTLGNVINLLVQSSTHIPYRNSKLTKLLSDSLGGNSRTLMLANIGPACSNYAETHQTLKYASRAKQIKNKPIINEDPKDALLRQKHEELILLKRQIEQMTISSTALQKQIGSADKENTMLIPSKINNIENIRREGESVEEEKSNLKKQVLEIKNKIKLCESEKTELINKYSLMCKEIITDENYEKDLISAKNELDNLLQKSVDQKKVLETKKLFQEKKFQVDKVDAKTKLTQDRINELNIDIAKLREQMIFFKTNKTTLTQKSLSNIAELNSKIEESKTTLKKQLFFINNLIPKRFQSLYETSSKTDERFKCIESYPLNQLRKPISISKDSIADFYINPFIKDICLKKIKLEFPTFNQLLNEGSIIRFC